MTIQEFIASGKARTQAPQEVLVLAF